MEEPEPDASAPDVVDPFRSATTNLQAAARWIVTALAAVGGVLVAGVPLTGLGKLQGWADRWIAIGALGGALFAIAIVIPQVAKVFTTEYVTLARLATSEVPEWVGQDTGRVASIIDAIHESDEELFGDQGEDIGEVYDRLRRVNVALRSQRKAESLGQRLPRRPSLRGRAGLSRPPMPQQAARAEGEAGVAGLRIAAQRIVDFANYEATRRRFVGLYWKLAAAGSVVAVGVGTYAFMVSKPPEDEISNPRPILLSLPPHSAEASRLGPRCDLRDVAAVAVAGSMKRPTVVVVPTATCQAARFRVPKGAVVVPAKDLPALPTGATSRPAP